MATYKNESQQSINRKEMILIVSSFQNKRKANNRMLVEIRKVSNNFSELELKLFHKTSQFSFVA